MPLANENWGMDTIGDGSEYVALVFADADRNVTRAAEHAGLSRRHFRELLYKHGLLTRAADGDPD